VLWGALNGVYLLVGIVTKPMCDRAFAFLGLGTRSRTRMVVGVPSTFLLTCAAWVLFRAQSVPDAWYILTHFWQGWDLGAIRTEQFLMRQMPVAVLSIVFLEIVELFQRRAPVTFILSRQPLVWRWAVYVCFVTAVVLFGVYRENQFIYFQF
jgi:alginate O-acetyltransferase complex protein AlgI